MTSGECWGELEKFGPVKCCLSETTIVRIVMNPSRWWGKSPNPKGYRLEFQHTHVLAKVKDGWMGFTKKIEGSKGI